MGTFFAGLLGWALGSFVTRLLAAFGFGFATYAVVTSLVTAALNRIEPMLSQLPATILSILMLAGVDQAISIIASALLTRAVFLSMRLFVFTLAR